MFTQKVIDSAITHAEAEAPNEACGLVVMCAGIQGYVPCTNISMDRNQFIISPDEYADIEDNYEIVGVAHSHYGVLPNPSMADLVGCESSDLPWLIVSYPSRSHHVLYPKGFIAPLKGRPFYCGILDCYSIVRDYHKINLGIDVKDYERSSDWWLHGKNHFIDRFQDAGFVERSLAQLETHDVLLMKCNSTVPNHAAVYLGGNKILHHLTDRLSGEDVYGGYWLKATVAVIRHKDLL